MAKNKHQDTGYFKKRARRTSAGAVFSVAMVLFMLGLVGLLVIHAKSVITYIKENIEVQVFISDLAEESDIKRIGKQLESANFVKELNFVSKDDAAELLKKDLGEDFVDFLGKNPLLPSYDIRLKEEYANTDSLIKIERYVMSNGNVREVDYKATLFDLVNSNLRKITFGVIGICILFLLITLVIINNSIKLGLHAKRFTIRSMQLVGATRGFIQKPFLMRAIGNGVISGGIAIILLLGVLYYADLKLPELTEIRNNELIFGLLISIVIIGVTIAFSSTYFSVRRYLNSNVEELYL